MSNGQGEQHFQIIRHWLMTLQQENRAGWEEIDAVLEDLQVTFEQTTTRLESAEIAEETLLQQNQQLTAGYDRYRDLFQSAPIAYLVTDTNGVIVEANGAIAQLLRVPQPYLVGNPLSLYVAESDRATFRTHLNQLSQTSKIQVLQITMRPREGDPFAAEWHIAPFARSAQPQTHSVNDKLEGLQIVVYDLSQFQPKQLQSSLSSQSDASTLPLPQSLDGLRVLVVDDEADIREFMMTVLEVHGIEVKTVASAAAALAALDQFHPNVLLSDLRMPDGDGYSLIRQIRALEGETGIHLPAAAMTAYLEEDREQAMNAGFEVYLHKLAQPTEWVGLVIQLARQSANFDRGFEN